MRSGSEIPILSRASDAFHFGKDPVFSRLDPLDKAVRIWYNYKNKTISRREVAAMKNAVIIVVVLIVVAGAAYTIVRTKEQKNHELELMVRKSESAQKKADAERKKAEAEIRRLEDAVRG